MKYQLIFLVTLAYVLNVSDAGVTQVCEPGSVFKKDCNECKCNTDGTDMACTRKMCSGSEDGAEPVPENTENTENTENKPTVSEADKCTPGESFKIGCNDCVCTPDGLKSNSICTLLACPDEVPKTE